MTPGPDSTGIPPFLGCANEFDLLFPAARVNFIFYT
jgi:hypothetical protein